MSAPSKGAQILSRYGSQMESSKSLICKCVFEHDKAYMTIRSSIAHLDEDVSHSRLSVAWVTLAGHNANGLAVDLIVIEILKSFDSCTKQSTERTAAL